MAQEVQDGQGVPGMWQMGRLAKVGRRIDDRWRQEVAELRRRRLEYETPLPAAWVSIGGMQDRQVQMNGWHDLRRAALRAEEGLHSNGIDLRSKTMWRVVAGKRQEQWRELVRWVVSGISEQRRRTGRRRATDGGRGDTGSCRHGLPRTRAGVRGVGREAAPEK